MAECYRTNKVALRGHLNKVVSREAARHQQCRLRQLPPAFGKEQAGARWRRASRSGDKRRKRTPPCVRQQPQSRRSNRLERRAHPPAPRKRKPLRAAGELRMNALDCLLCVGSPTLPRRRDVGQSPRAEYCGTGRDLRGLNLRHGTGAHSLVLGCLAPPAISVHYSAGRSTKSGHSPGAGPVRNNEVAQCGRSAEQHLGAPPSSS